MSAATDQAEQRAAREAFLDALVFDDPIQLYERAPCGFLSTTPDGLVVKANATLRTWLGVDAADLVGEKFFVDLLAPGSRIYHETHYAPTLQMQGSVREMALDLVTSEGRRLPVLVNASLDHDDRGHPAVIRIAVFDATERRSYERELLRAKQRAQESEASARALAHTLQQSLVPPAPAEVPGLDVAVAFRSAADGLEIGGDFFDVFPSGPDEWVVVIGDVCGKGAEAAVVAGLVRHTVRALAISETSPGRLLDQINHVLLRHESDRFCTAILALLKRTEDGWRITFGNAGHPLPVLLRQGQDPCLLEQGLGPLLGVIGTTLVTDTVLEVHASDTLVFYTDGVTEARSGSAFFGEQALLNSLRGKDGHAASELVDGLVEDVLAFRAGGARDDIAVVAVRVP